MTAKLTTKGFVQRAKQVHGNMYSYTKVNYTGWDSNVVITCKRHGTFEQRPSNHLSGKGCQACGGNLRKTTVETLKLLKQKYGSSFSYEKVPASAGVNDTVEITCKRHGAIFKTLRQHLNHGCQECQKLTHAEFKALAVGVHGTKYEYHDQYTNMRTKIQITCRRHGNFLQSPTNHLNGTGCRKCFVESLQLTTKDFIQRAKAVHGDTYSYKAAEYMPRTKNSRRRIKIICKKHGPFMQGVGNHLNGRTCPKCQKDSLLVRLGRRTIKVRSVAEQQVARSLTSWYEITATDILTEHDAGFPVFPGNFHNNGARSRKYTPDFYIKSLNLIIEVKSPSTFGLAKYMDIQPGTLIPALKKKAKAVSASGFNFEVILMHHGKELVLPEDWESMSNRALVSWYSNLRICRKSPNHS